jgi:hypothetical protein
MHRNIPAGKRFYAADKFALIGEAGVALPHL